MLYSGLVLSFLSIYSTVLAEYRVEGGLLIRGGWWTQCQWLATIRQATHSSLCRRREVMRRDGKSDRWSQRCRFCLFSLSKHNNNSRNSYTSKNITFSSGYLLLTVTSNHLPRPHRESPWGDEKLSDTLTAETGRKWKMWISKFSLNNIEQILLHIKDYNIWNSFSLIDMRLLPQK